MLPLIAKELIILPLVLKPAPELLYAIPIGLLFAYAYRFNPLIFDGFKLDTSAGWMNLPNSGL